MSIKKRKIDSKGDLADKAAKIEDKIKTLKTLISISLLGLTKQKSEEIIKCLSREKIIQISDPKAVKNIRDEWFTEDNIERLFSLIIQQDDYYLTSSIIYKLYDKKLKYIYEVVYAEDLSKMFPSNYFKKDDFVYIFCSTLHGILSTYEKRYNEEEHIKKMAYNSVIIMLNKEIPSEVILHIFSFCKKDRLFLNAVGLVNEKFYLAALKSWDILLITPNTNLQVIPRLVFGNTRHYIFKEDIRKSWYSPKYKNEFRVKMFKFLINAFNTSCKSITFNLYTKNLKRFLKLCFDLNKEMFNCKIITFGVIDHNSSKKSLALGDINLDENSIFISKKIFPNLNELHIQDDYINERYIVKHEDNVFSSIKTLVIGKIIDEGNVHDCKYDAACHLKCIYNTPLKAEKIHLNFEYFEQLRKLKMLAVFENFPTNMLNFIAEKITYLKLYTYNNQNSKVMLSNVYKNFKNLESFDLTFFWHDDFNYLFLQNFFYDIYNLSKLKNLKINFIIHINYSIGLNAILKKSSFDGINNLYNLKNLKLKYTVYRCDALFGGNFFRLNVDKKLLKKLKITWSNLLKPIINIALDSKNLHTLGFKYGATDVSYSKISINSEIISPDCLPKDLFLQLKEHYNNKEYNKESFKDKPTHYCSIMKKKERCVNKQ